MSNTDATNQETEASAREMSVTVSYKTTVHIVKS
jgi:hypothetical protein